MCSRVLFPEPELPTMAIRSPLLIWRLMFSSTWIFNPPSVKDLARLRADKTESVIAKSLGRVHLGGAPGRVKCGENGQYKCSEGDHTDIIVLNTGRQTADVIDIGRQELVTNQTFQ